MSDQFEYLHWRGDLSFKMDKFNETDGSILAMLSYINYDEISKAPIKLRDAVSGYCPDKKYDKVRLGLIIPSKKINKLFCTAGQTSRFADCVIDDFTCKTSTSEICQFAAVTYHLPNKRAVICFRGTDDSLVGWREDCCMSYLDEIPAQRMAVEYLEMISEKYPGKRLYLVGHSKGGNLAAYSTVKCSEGTRAKIVHAYSYDGPGFSKSLTESPEYKAASRKIVMIVPQSSFIGTMFEPGKKYTVVNGMARGAFQHDCFTWEISGPQFVRVDGLSIRGRKNRDQFAAGMERMSLEERRKFVETFFSIIESTGASTLTEFADGKLKTISSLIKNYTGLDKQQRDIMLGLVLKLFDMRRD